MKKCYIHPLVQQGANTNDNDFLGGKSNGIFDVINVCFILL